MNKQELTDRLANKTVEICLRVLVRPDAVEDIERAFVATVEEQDGYVVCIGGYVEPPEYHEAEEVAKQLAENPEEPEAAKVLERIKKLPKDGNDEVSS